MHRFCSVIKLSKRFSPFGRRSTTTRPPLSNHADDDEQRYASLPTSKGTQPSTEQQQQRRKSNDELFYEAMDQFEEDPVIKLCFSHGQRSVEEEKQTTTKRQRQRRPVNIEKIVAAQPFPCR